MGKFYTALGLMSGTSLDGVDVSIINSDGVRDYSVVLNKFYEYENELYEKIIELRANILNSNDLKRYFSKIKSLEKEITLFNAQAVNETLKLTKQKIEVIGFHGQTIFHDAENSVTKQLGDGRLLSQLTKKKIVYNFRQNDLNNGGQGAPLTPIFHNLIANKISKKFNIDFPINILNIGGIANVTTTVNDKDISYSNNIEAYDVGPGNCLIDEWIRKNSRNKYDKGGLLAESGKTDKLVLNQALENFDLNLNYEKSLDIKDFNIFFAKGLSLENGASTITDFTSQLISDAINFIHNKNESKINNWLVCGGGRKNKYLLESIENKVAELKLNPIEKYNIEGDFVESQAFAYLAIRTLNDMPISFPTTTRCKKPTLGGVVIKNY